MLFLAWDRVLQDGNAGRMEHTTPLATLLMILKVLGIFNLHVGPEIRGYSDGSIVGVLICDAWNKSATVGNATRGFKVTGIFPFKNNVLPDKLFFALADSTVPVPENTTQEEENSSSEVLINTPQINLQSAEPGISRVKPPSPTKHLHKISPIPSLSQVTPKHRINLY
ncbi:hypothetical protein AVEN_80628-1 [Araneus ventricosus]|uniref:Uncharacterized protein n=1 Tax=Araneus ventricosus TaxID=182803 RepID=A0A4Y2U1K0_ARAVE|nr:hypothetical protein AVEN_80628-1 [Araneus ventricosus]